ncbi:hypothetical protein H6P81_014623 [Aristolochia fimbriata]|uniref:Zinc-ribbon domain-containing protein n=1 Tax=Aristolochia fimbriata TaxID=158543 RepID=A0AAV7E7N0_ARIFI|nr:hypothetical protein H6P81_014623 [Aristolochia fimbriata]
MAGRPTKVRFVKCPKCKQILPEFANIPVYQCGGCGAVLKAKYREVGGECSAAESFENSERKPEDTESVASTKQPVVHNSGDEELICLSQGNSGLESDLSDKSLTEHRETNDDVALSGEATLWKEVLSQNGRSRESNGADEVGTSDSRIEIPDLLKEEGCSNSTGQSETSEKVQPVLNLDCENQSQDDQEIKTQHYLDAEVGTSSGQLLSNNMKIRDTVDGSSDSVISEDMVDTKNNEKLESLLKSPTTRSYYAYYGNYSSNGDDFDYHISTRNRNQHVSKRAFKPSRVADSVSTEEKPPRREDPLVGMSADPERQTQVAELSQLASVASSDRFGTACSQSFNWDQEEQLESNGYEFQAYEQERLLEPKVSDPVRSWMESESVGPSKLSPRATPDGRYSTSVHQDNNLPNDRHEELERFGQHQVDRLWKVERLRDQLNRLSGPSERGRGKFPRGGHAQELSGYSANPVKHHVAAYEKRRMAPQYYESSKIHFSGPPNCRHHVDYSCSYCYGDGWRCSAQLPPICYSNGLCQTCAVHIHHRSYGPSPTSSQQLSGPGFHGPFFPNTTALLHEERPLDHEMEMLHYREKRNMLKRHCRPIVGGAPFLACYKCCKLLQIPADFLPMRRHQKLRCGACSEVLTFSIQGRNHIMPFRPIDVQHHLSPSTSQKGLQGDPVSCSDDYGHPSCYYSTEGATSQNDMLDKMQGSCSSIEPIQGEKMVCEQTKKEIVDRQGSTLVLKLSKMGMSGVSPQRSTSPLHRLMGYSSPGEIINGVAYEADNLGADLHSDATSKALPKKILGGAD